MGIVGCGGEYGMESGSVVTGEGVEKWCVGGAECARRGVVAAAPVSVMTLTVK